MGLYCINTKILIKTGATTSYFDLNKDVDNSLCLKLNIS